MTNEALTDVMYGREIQSGSGSGLKGTFTYRFTDGSQMRLQDCRQLSTRHPIAPLVSARQQDARLMLDSEHAEMLEVELTEATSRILVWDKDGVLEYAGGSDPATWGVPAEDEGNLVPETPETAWRRGFDCAIVPVEVWMIYLLEPALLKVRAHRRRKPGDGNWLCSLLERLRQAHFFLRMGREVGAETTEEAERFQRAKELAQQGARENVAWAKEQMQRELADLARRYRSGSWIEALGKGYRHQFWFDLDGRDRIEAYLWASKWLHPDLAPDPQFVRIVEETDARLRVEGPLIWEVDPPTRIDGERRTWRYRREDWWWWLDRAGESDGAAST
jgi:hypothetical protein